MTRSISVFACLLPAALLLCAPVGVLHAQRSIDIKLALPSGENSTTFDLTTNPELVEDYFNLARCQCAESLPTVGATYWYFEVEMTAEDISIVDEADLMVGTACDNDDPTVRNCELIESQIDVGSLTGGPNARRQIPVDALMFPNAECTVEEPDSNVWMLFDDGADDIIDDFSVLADFDKISADAQPPPAPFDLKAEGAESAVVVSWAANVDDVEYFYVLCADADGQEVFESPQAPREYDTSMTLCGLPTVGGSPPTGDAGVPDAGMSPDAGMGPDAGTGPDASTGNGDVLSGMEESFICGRVPASSTSLRVEGLDNGNEYQFAVIAVDEARNPTYVRIPGTAQPQPADDFWEHYGDEGGQAEGGVCLVTSTFGEGGPTQTLRDFRDGTLASFWLGRVFIDSYYEYIAPLGAYADRYVAARIVAAVILAPCVVLAGFWEYTGPFAKLLVLCLFLCWRRRRQLLPLWRQWTDRGRDRAAALAAEFWPDVRIPTGQSVAAAAALLAVLSVGLSPAVAQGSQGAFDRTGKTLRRSSIARRSNTRSGTSASNSGPISPISTASSAVARWVPTGPPSAALRS